jgi:hypothetical protein
MSKAGTYRKKADDYGTLALRTYSIDLRQHYEALAHEYRDLADAEEKAAAKRYRQSDQEIEHLAERMVSHSKL